MNQVFAGNPDHYKTTLKRVADATAADLKTAANAGLPTVCTRSRSIRSRSTRPTQTSVDRKKLPDAGPPPEAKFPELQRATLANGLKIVLAERHSIPQVNFQLMIDAGYAADQFGLPGTGGMTFSMLDDGTKRRNALQISDELLTLGADLNAGSDLDTSAVSLSALKENLDASLDLFADVILNPSFPQEDFARLQKQRLSQIQQEKVQPIGIALRVFAGLLYGPGHAYGNPFTGTGTEESVSKLKREDLIKFHQTWFKPNTATLIVVGDTTMAEIKPKLEKLFQGWQRGEVPTKNIGTVALPQKQVVYIVDRPGSEQSVILASNLAPPKANKDESAIETMNTLLGRNIHFADQHEPARGQALVLRGRQLLVRCAWPAAVYRLCAGTDGQDKRVDRRDRKRTERDRGQPAGGRGRIGEGSGFIDADASGFVGNDERIGLFDRQHRSLRPG